MSYTEIYKFKKNGNAQKIGDINNAFRGAMAVWSILEKKYLPPFMPSWANGKPGNYTRLSDFKNAIKEIWNLLNAEQVSESDKIVLCSTFDNVIVLKEDLPKLITVFREFEGDTSLPEQADILENYFNTDDDLIAVAWNQTSVNGDCWINYGGINDDSEAIPYNILTMTDRHWNLFEPEKEEKI